MIGYKLVRKRKDGSYGPLFINRKQRLDVGVWLEAEDHPTKGYAHRPGWHILAKPEAPHLSTKGRVWVKVIFPRNASVEHVRPSSQGGTWYTAPWVQIVGEVTPGE